MYSWDAQGSSSRVGRLARGIRLMRFTRFARPVQVLNDLVHKLSVAKEKMTRMQRKHSSMQRQLVDFGVLRVVASTLQHAEVGKKHRRAIHKSVLPLGVRLLEPLDGTDVLGATHCQDRMYDLLSKNSSGKFVLLSAKLMRDAGDDALRQIERRFPNGAVVDHVDNAQPSILPYASRYARVILQLRFLQACCCRHHRALQGFMREQPGLVKSANLVEHAVNLIVAVAREASAVERAGFDELQLLVHVIDFLISSVQGPCAANQALIIQVCVALRGEHCCPLLVNFLTLHVCCTAPPPSLTGTTRARANAAA